VDGVEPSLAAGWGAPGYVVVSELTYPPRLWATALTRAAAAASSPSTWTTTEAVRMILGATAAASAMPFAVPDAAEPSPDAAPSPATVEALPAPPDAEPLDPVAVHAARVSRPTVATASPSGM
jgi:hypothetical protein